MSWRNWRPTRKFFAALEQCDQEIACRLSEAARCLRCGGGLHRADFPRKPMGCTGLSSGPCRRVSFCCRQRDCRRRLTPPSFRFPDRKWYVLFVVLLAAAVGPSGPEHVTGVVEVAGASPSLRSVRRWQRHFRTDFANSPQWQFLRARLLPPPSSRQLPGSLLGWVAAREGQAPEVSIAQTIGLLAHSGSAHRITPIDGLSTIRREWHC